MPQPDPGAYDPSFYDPAGAVIDQLAAVSVGVVDGEVRLDLDYFDDSRARRRYERGVDRGRASSWNCRAGRRTARDSTAATMNRLLDLAETGCRGLMGYQMDALGR